jgi:hypothetical protein
LNDYYDSELPTSSSVFTQKCFGFGRSNFGSLLKEAGGATGLVPSRTARLCGFRTSRSPRASFINQKEKHNQTEGKNIDICHDLRIRSGLSRIFLASDEIFTTYSSHDTRTWWTTVSVATGSIKCFLYMKRTQPILFSTQDRGT